MRRCLGVLALVVTSMVGLASPAQAASGPWAVVSAGETHTCAVSTAKSLYCWGENSDGELGDGTFDQRTTPKRIGSAGVWASVSTGSSHSCAITTAKSLYCWGLNGNGQLGDGTIDDRDTPKRIGTAGAWATVTARHTYTCAITTGKSLYCWGSNNFGRLGDGTEGIDRLAPRKIGNSGVWANVAAGGNHTCAVSTAKSLYCWGSNAYGAIGDGTVGMEPQLTPKRIGSAGVWAGAAVGGAHSCAVSTGKSLYCWGLGLTGAIGDGTTDDRHAPKRIGTAGAWANVTAGILHTCAVTTGKSLYCWGTNNEGQLGDGTVDTRLAPKRIGTAGVWLRAAGGQSGHSCAITTASALYCWGANNHGQLGDGTTDPRLSPRKVA